jgi:hypothetical protein
MLGIYYLHFLFNSKTRHNACSSCCREVARGAIMVALYKYQLIYYVFDFPQIGFFLLGGFGGSTLGEIVVPGRFCKG